MNQQTKLGLIVLALLALSGFGSAFFFSQVNQRNLQQAELRDNQLKQQLAKTEEENQTLAQREQALIDDKKTAEERAANTAKDLEEVKQELVKTKDELNAVNAQLETLRSERDSLAGELKKLRAAGEELQRTMSELRKEKSASEKTATDLKQHVARLEEENRTLKTQSPSLPQLVASTGEPLPFPSTAPEGQPTMLPLGGPAVTPAPGAITLPPIIIERHAASTARSAGLTGRVINVNQQHRFAIIDRGATDGVAVGDRFFMTSNQRNLGVVTVIRVRETIAACDMSALGPEARVRVGDVVSFQSSSQH